MKLSLQLVTPERTVLKESYDSLSCPTTLGQITILPGHAALVATLVSGELVARKGPTEAYLHVAGGFVEVRPGNEIVILADAAEHFYEIDQQMAEQAKKQAEEILQSNVQSDEEYARARSMLERNLSRLRIARKHAHRKSPITGEGVFHE